MSDDRAPGDERGVVVRAGAGVAVKAGRSTQATPGEQAGRRRWGVLAICCLSLLIVGLDNTIVNVALPAMSHDLHTAVSGLQWIVDAYTLVLASLLMLSGSMADRLGRRRVFQVGLVIFGVGSLLCSLASSVGLLIAFRAVQAVGGSMLNPVALSIITNTFTDRRERARAMGVWAAIIGVSMALGPIVGGTLVSSVGWRSIFWVNVPVVVAAIALTARFVPESRAPRARRLDPAGQVLVIVLFATATFAIIEGPGSGWGSAKIVIAFAVAAVSACGLLAWERRPQEPLIDLRFFASLPFSGATVVAACAFASLGGFLFLNTLYLQQTRGMSPLDAGLHTLPMAVLTIIVAPISGRIVAARGPRIPLLAGGLGITASAAILVGLSDHTSYALLAPAYVLFGAGFGVLNAPISNAAVSGMPRAQAGVAAGIASTSRQIGQALGVAVVGALAGTATGASTHVDIAHASHPGWWVILGCGIAITATGFAITTPAAHATAAKVARTLMGDDDAS